MSFNRKRYNSFFFKTRKNFCIFILMILICFIIGWISIRQENILPAVDKVIMYPFDIFYDVNKIYGIIGAQFYAVIVIPLITILISNRNEMIQKDYTAIRLISRKKIAHIFLLNNAIISLIVTITLFFALIISAISLSFFDFTILAEDSINGFQTNPDYLIFFQKNNINWISYFISILHTFFGLFYIINFINIMLLIIKEKVIAFIVITSIFIIDVIKPVVGISRSILLEKAIFSPHQFIDVSYCTRNFLILSLLIIIEIVLIIIINSEMDYLNKRSR